MSPLPPTPGAHPLCPGCPEPARPAQRLRSLTSYPRWAVGGTGLVRSLLPPGASQTPALPAACGWEGDADSQGCWGLGELSQLGEGRGSVWTQGPKPSLFLL